MTDLDPLPAVLARLSRLPAAQAADAARADQGARWRAGDRPPAEEYLAALPAVAADREQALVLICGEVLERTDRGESVGEAEYRRRFPHLAAQLADQFALHAARAAPPTGATGAYHPPPPDCPPAERFAPGAVLAGRYRVVAALGKGGMGEVYRADDLTLGQPVALKFLPEHLADDPDRLARFRKEVATARRVSHPNVCRVYDIAGHAGDSFLTMEFVDGEDLAGVVKRIGRLPEEKAVEVARQLCSALAAVHDQGLLHRDLKPANVMLDGRGRVRLTDFGLAAAAQDLTGTEVRSGTPLYQAPEQWAGREVTVRSDVYALGLVLYEVFTGRRPYPGPGRDGPPSKPSSHVTGLEPTVEAVILECLAADPAGRPRSAAAVLARLPGGDPLAAAVAAGQTPSPQLVADALTGEGALRPGVAGAMLAGVVVLLVLIAGMNDRFKAHRHVPFPPPAVLEEKAARMVRDLGYADPPADTAGGFEMPPEHRGYMDRNGRRPVVPVDQMATCRPPLLTYWHRQSPRPLLPVQVSGPGELSPANPPYNVPGMVTLWIDTRGRLVEFRSVPDPAAAHPGAPIDWDVVLKLAELDAPGALRSESDAQPTPPVFADQTRVWSGAYPEWPDMAVRVEAAAHRGRLVYFRITHPDWGDPSPDRPAPAADRRAVVLVVIAAVVWCLLLAWCVVAVRNVLRGRADVRGGLGVAALAGGLVLTHELSVGVHFSSWETVPQLVTSHLMWVVYLAVILFGGYLALEPLVRRRCPHRLISWTRLMGGRWRDPVVGRHVLIGVLAGLACALDGPTTPFWPSPQGSGPSVAHLTFFTRPLGELGGNVAAAVMVTWLYAGLFGILLKVCRREWVVVVVLVAVVVAPFFVQRFPVLTQAFTVLRAAVLFGLFLRLGILPTVAALTGINVAMHAPLSLDGSAWYFGASLTYLAAVVGLAGFAAYTATEGRLLGLPSGGQDD